MSQTLIHRALRRIPHLFRILGGLLSPRPKPIYRPHHYLHFDLTPHYRSPDGAVSHNSYGFRGSEFALPKPVGIVRVVCIGESTTYCTGVRDSETWPARLAVKLAAAGIAAEVINAGVPAYTSSEVLLNYVFKIEPLKPDWLVYYFTINDVRPRQIGIVSRDYREYCRPWTQKVRLRSWEDLRTYLAHRNTINYRARNMLHVDHAEANIFKTDASVFHENIRDLVTLARAHGSRVLLVCPRFRNLSGEASDLESEDPISWAVAQHRAAIYAIGAETGQPVLDMISLMPQPPWSKAEKSDVYLDSVHMTAKGLDVFADFVAQTLGRHISKQDLKDQSGAVDQQ